MNVDKIKILDYKIIMELDEFEFYCFDKITLDNIIEVNNDEYNNYTIKNDIMDGYMIINIKYNKYYRLFKDKDVRKYYNFVFNNEYIYIYVKYNKLEFDKIIKLKEYEDINIKIQNTKIKKFVDNYNLNKYLSNMFYIENKHDINININSYIIDLNLLIFIFIKIIDLNNENNLMIVNDDLYEQRLKEINIFNINITIIKLSDYKKQFNNIKYKRLIIDNINTFHNFNDIQRQFTIYINKRYYFNYIKMINIFKNFDDFGKILEHINNINSLIIINDKCYKSNIINNLKLHYYNEIFLIRNHKYYPFLYNNKNILNIENILKNTTNKFIINTLQNLNINDECNICMNNKIQTCGKCYHFFCNYCITTLNKCPLCNIPIIYNELIYISENIYEYRIDYVIKFILENQDKKNIIFSNYDKVINIFKKKLNNTIIIKPIQSYNIALYDNIFIMEDDIKYDTIFSNYWFDINYKLYVFKN
jgi:hypothetical protein